jgi:hypothetical protein
MYYQTVYIAGICFDTVVRDRLLYIMYFSRAYSTLRIPNEILAKKAKCRLHRSFQLLIIISPVP